MVAPRLDDRSALCPTCDALVGALSALMAERPGVLPTAAELSVRSAISKRELVQHVGDPIGCFVLAFERATDRILVAATADGEGEDAPPARLEALVQAQLRGLTEDRPAGAIVLAAPRLPDPRIQEAVTAWRQRYTAAIGDPREPLERGGRDGVVGATAVAVGRRG